MPRQVEREQRLDQIAIAALAVARRDGATAVTFRRVATEMGADSTTVVTHYVDSRAALVQLMLSKLFAAAESLAGPILDAMAPADGLRLLARGVLPITDESRLEAWGSWLRDRVVSLVAQISPGDHSRARADALLVSLAGFTLYGLVDGANWPPERQRDALEQLLIDLELQGGDD